MQNQKVRLALVSRKVEHTPLSWNKVARLFYSEMMQATIYSILSRQQTKKDSSLLFKESDELWLVLVLTSLAVLLLIIGEKVIQGVLWCFSVFLLLLRG